MDIDKMAEHEIEMVESVKTWSDKTLADRYNMIRNNAEANIRLCLIIAIELESRGYRQNITWTKVTHHDKEEKIICLGCGEEYNKSELMKYSKDHWYCAECIANDDDECPVNADGCLVNNDGDAETDMEERR